MDIFHEILKKKRKEFSPQSVLYIQNLRRIKLITRETPNLQILLDHGYGDIGHWICTYFDGNNNHIYDSLNRNSLSAQQEQYLKCLYPFPFKNVFPQVQQQTNQYDCGIYAIAFATTICFNKNPANQIYHIPDMRTHAEQIFLTKTLMEFPSIPKDWKINRKTKANQFPRSSYQQQKSVSDQLSFQNAKYVINSVIIFQQLFLFSTQSRRVHQFPKWF